ncbi:hypothetical protein BSKO_06848 [Bryopsis sp. KO-2023]|nr:hypothetical protein BSKO_06848 [Bryopsis sp. KO-2023]
MEDTDMDGPHGYIFGCTSETIDECLGRCLFGSPVSHWKEIQLITTGTPLFLFVYTTRELLGGFFAMEPGGLDVEPDAFGWRFPCQVRVKRRKTATEVIAESEFRPVLKDNYYDKRKFKFGLTKEQVIGLNKLFNPGKRRIPNPPPDPMHPSPGKKRRNRWSNRRPEKLPINKKGQEQHRENESFGSNGRAECWKWTPSHKMTNAEIENLFDPEESGEAINCGKLESGEEQRCTVLFGPLPGEVDFTVELVVKILNETHKGKYDFLYVRYSQSTRHCVVNLTESGEVLELVDRFHGKKWSDVLSRAEDGGVEIKVAFWGLQGMAELGRKFCGEGFWHTGGASSCGELYDNRALFFYGAGAKFGSRVLPLPRGGSPREEGVSPRMAFLNGWPKLLREDFKSHSETDAEANYGQTAMQSADSIDGKSISRTDKSAGSVDSKSADQLDISSAARVNGKSAGEAGLKSAGEIDAKSANKTTSGSLGMTDSEIIILDEMVETIDLS